MENYEPITETNTTPVGNDKLFAILAYFGLFFLLGLLIAPEKDHAFTKNHVNNGIWLFIGQVVNVIPVIGQLVALVLFVFAIMGIVAAAQGNTFTIPVIGDKLPKLIK